MPSPSNAILESMLVERARHGDLRAFEQLLEGHQQRTFQWLLARVPPGVDAEDVLQQSLLTAYDRLDSFAGDSRFGTWLIGITHNCLRNAIRSQRRDRTIPLGNTRQLLDEMALAEHDRGTELDALRHCLTTLNERLGDLLDRFYAQGQTVTAIAGALARPVGTVKRHLFEARQTLLGCIRQRLGEREDG